MPEARTTWTDERMDDLARRVENGFARVDARFDHVEARIDAQGAELSRRIDAVSAELGGRIDSLQRTMIQFGGATTVGIFATLVTVVLTRA
jgi:tetrahydromethanopterin S-methyltransferase subunit G